ncbi:class I SAM-dependent methyltransferase [Oscillochloris sp. ZM17-4]|uniref:SAM-dependent methyltransferase n=1 Tax=Oscillochloris sp. ZM17-4 TaxID=2866714 RepID=UPI001C73C3CD|nr:class I SAM-dependent methyltransferase [Oscillochloris sp. ZM17-4]MBX0327031.1 class I SAM-dependent methyltransferase [Oscillochloris sp. ZM17-4]
MTDPTPSRFEALQRRYRECDLPWDRDLPPPEVVAIADQLPPGRLLDLGSGSGRACIYLAQRGWHADGVDFVPEAITLAESRVAAAGVAGQVRLHQGSVTHMPFLEPPYDLAIDVGCMHAFHGDDLRDYAGELRRLLRPGGLYLLFAHLRNRPDEPLGVSEATIRDLFTDDFLFEHVEHGKTTVVDTRWNSAWFYLRRR